MYQQLRSVSRFAVGAFFLTTAAIPAADAQETISTFFGQKKDAQFGSSVALYNAGVLDRLAVGSPEWDNGRGRLEIFDGSKQKLLFALEGAAAGDQLGAAVASLGDITGDHVEELIVGAPGENGEQGRVRVLSGSDFSLLYDLHSVSEPSHFGKAVSDAGDVDADGVHDIIIG
ncbi:MAG: FG-GAP repeat protein, partial [Bdellovibrionales bacterium]|nr:FG-GAP repeat protein [Bdellovibrionales bacterium]